MTIGNHACNKDNVCAYCEKDSTVPDGACNEGSDNDITDGKCNYCHSNFHHTTTKVVYVAKNKDEDLDIDTVCNTLAEEVNRHLYDSIYEDYPPFKIFLHEINMNDAAHSNQFSVDSDSDSVSSSCKIKINMLSQMRLRNQDESTIEEHIQDVISNFVPTSGDFTLRDYLVASDLIPVEKKQVLLE